MIHPVQVLKWAAGYPHRFASQAAPWEEDLNRLVYQAANQVPCPGSCQCGHVHLSRKQASTCAWEVLHSHSTGTCAQTVALSLSIASVHPQPLYADAGSS